jgi:FG-GAP-like repeat
MGITRLHMDRRHRRVSGLSRTGIAAWSLAVAMAAVGCFRQGDAPGGGGGPDGGSGPGRDGGGGGGPTLPQCTAGVGQPTTCSSARYALGAATPNSAHGAFAVAVGDMNCDGYDDVVTANPNDDNLTPPDNMSTVGVMLNQRDGTFAAMAQYDAVSDGGPGGPAFAGAIALGDLDRDGAPDVVAFGGELGASPFYMLNDGTGKLGAPVPMPFTANDNAENQFTFGSNLAVVDMNGDGNLDVVVQPTSTDYVVVFMNQGRATFGANVDYEVFPGAPSSPDLGGFAVADFNGDGKPDVAVLDRGNVNITVLLNTGNGTLGAPTHFPITNEGSIGLNLINRLAAADFDGDGKIDLAYSDQHTKVGIARNKGGGTFAPPTFLTVTESEGGALIAADLDHDGHPDLVLTQSGTGGTMQVLMNAGGGSFGAPVPLAAGSTTTRVAAGNFKGDGLLGLAVTSFDNFNHPQAPAPTLYTVDATCSR